MKKKLIGITLVTALAAGFGAGGANAQSLLLDYVGYDYESPDPNPADFGEVGSGYVGVGMVPVLFAPLVFDSVANEYTYHLFDLESAVQTVVGNFVIITYAGPGLIRVYCDDRNTGTPADYGANPPNASAPSSFTDGDLILEGELTAFQIILNTVSGSGSYEAEFTAVGGSQLGNIPLSQREGWTFSGLTSNEINAPDGYEHQVDGQIFLTTTVGVESTTWGRIKQDFNRRP